MTPFDMNTLRFSKRALQAFGIVFGKPGENCIIIIEFRCLELPPSIVVLQLHLHDKYHFHKTASIPQDQFFRETTSIGI